MTDQTAKEPFIIRDAEALRAVAHPLRQRIMVELIAVGHGRAADLARRLDAPPNAVSFHLRVLAKAGLIVEAPELARDKRDRVWATVSESYDVDPSVQGIDTLLGPIVDVIRENVAVVTRDGGHPEPDDGPKRSLTANVTMLTREQAVAMSVEVNDVIKRWTDSGTEVMRKAPGTPGLTAYRIVWAIGPMRGGDPGPRGEE